MHTDLLPHHHGEEEHHNIDQIRAQLAKADNFQIVADIFKQVGDPSRVRIFWLLCHCEECVQNISALMEMSSPAVSHHLRGLKDNGLIVSRRVGKEVFYKAATRSTAEPGAARLAHIARRTTARIRSATAVGQTTPPRSTGVPNAAQAVHTAAMTMPIMLTATATACVMAAGVK